MNCKLKEDFLVKIERFLGNTFNMKIMLILFQRKEVLNITLKLTFYGIVCVNSCKSPLKLT